MSEESGHKEINYISLKRNLVSDTVELERVLNVCLAGGLRSPTASS